jgi:hypothetical protein
MAVAFYQSRSYYFTPDTCLKKSNSEEKKENEKDSFQLSGKQRWVYLSVKNSNDSK